MRTVLAGEVDQAQSFNSDYYIKLEVQNGSGTWIDVGNALGSHWIINGSWGEQTDTPVSQATFTLVENMNGASLAPLMSASVLNVDDFAAYSPLLDIGRLMRASTATMAHNVALDITKYRPAFAGRIDEVEGMDSPNKMGPITIRCSDLGSWLMDTQIEHEGKQYGSFTSSPTLEATLQSVINDNTPSGEPVPTLVKQSASSFAVTGWRQGETKLLDALTTLVLDSVGEDLRYRFDASHVSQLMWFNPDRSRVTVDATYTSNQYTLRRLNVSIRDIRNAGVLTYTDTTTGTIGQVSAVDLASSNPSRYRRRFFRLPSNDMLKTVTEAQTVINAVVNDLAVPPAEAEAVVNFAWFVQLYDRYTFQANGQQYDQDQTFAIAGYQHSIENSRGTTTLTLTARIVGAYASWLKRIGKSVDPNVSLNDFRVTAETDTTLTYSWTRGDRVDEVWVAQETFVNPLPSDPWATVKLLAAPLATGIDTITVTKPDEGSVLLLQVEARTDVLDAGDVRRVVINAPPTQLPSIELDDAENGTVGTQFWSITERGLTVTAVEVQTQVGTEPISAFGPPTRSPGAASTVRGGLLAAGQYEHDITLDATRLAWIMPRLTLSNGGLKTLGPFGFDRDKKPNILSVQLIGTVLTIICDSDTKSIKVSNSGATWIYQADGVGLTVDVSKTGTNGGAGLGTAASDTYTITAQSDPLAYVSGSTLTESRNQVVSGATAGAPSALWSTPGVTVTAPATIGSDVATINLLATAAPVGWTVAVFIYVAFSSSGTPTVDHTAGLSPALSAPPTVATDYSYSTTFIKSAHTGGTGLVTMKVRADLKDGGGVVQDTRSVTATWYSPV